MSREREKQVKATFPLLGSLEHLHRVSEAATRPASGRPFPGGDESLGVRAQPTLCPTWPPPGQVWAGPACSCGLAPAWAAGNLLKGGGVVASRV